MQVNYPYSIDPLYNVSGDNCLGFSDEDRLVFDSILEMSNKSFGPLYLESEQTGKLPDTVIPTMREYGLFGCCYPESMGGSGMTNVQQALIAKALGVTAPSTSILASIHWLSSKLFLQYAAEDLLQQFGSKFASGELILVFALTTPEAGSNPRLMRCTSVPEIRAGGNGYLINSSKTFISNAKLANYAVIVVKHENQNKFNMFLLDLSLPGVTISPPMKKIGQNSSYTSEVKLEDVWVPEAMRLGKEGDGWNGVTNLRSGRLNICGQNIGGTYACFAKAWEYAHQRELDGGEGRKTVLVADKPAIQNYFHDAYVDLARMDEAVFRAAMLYDQDPNSVETIRAITRAKSWVPETGLRHMNNMLQVFGGMGIMEETEIGIYWGSNRVTDIYEGSKEVMKDLNYRYLVDAMG